MMLKSDIRQTYGYMFVLSMLMFHQQPEN